MFKRTLRPKLVESLAGSPAVFLAGARQVGKTTLAQELAQETLGASYWTLDDALTRASARDDPEGFVDALELPAVIDEVQRVPELMLAVKRAIDRARQGEKRAKGMFLLTGSSNVWTTLSVSDSLAGRTARHTLWPLTQDEIEGSSSSFVDSLFAGSPPTNRDTSTGRGALAKRIVRGGYPEAVARDSAASRARWLRDYLGTILERDVREISNIRALDELPQMLSLLASRSSGVLNMAGVARDLGLPSTTTQRYFDLLRAVFIVCTIPAFKRNLGQRVIKGPKIYVCDTGLMTAQLGYDARRFEANDSNLAGPLLKTFVAMELLRQSSWASADVRVYHYRDTRGQEVDIVLESTRGDVVGIESKLSSSIGDSDLRGLKHLRSALGEKFRAGVVLHTGEATVPFGDRLWAMPVSALWQRPRGVRKRR